MMSDFDYEDLRSRAMAFGWFAAANGRSDSPADDDDFTELVEDIDTTSYSAMFEEFFILGFYEFFQQHGAKEIIPFKSVKYQCLKEIAGIARCLGEIASKCGSGYEFPGFDPLFAHLDEGIDAPAWKNIIAFEWGYGYESSMEADDAEGMLYTSYREENREMAHLIKAIDKQKRIAKRVCGMA